MLVVDAANVVGSVPDGWWRDRPGAARRLVERVKRSEGLGAVTVVLEGAAKRGVPEGRDGEVQVVHAPAEGDDTLVALSGPGVTVVTADRGLSARVRAAGGQVVGPSWLQERLPSA
jgi:uncharacterized protein YaiI (UPF0178 family)